MTLKEAKDELEALYNAALQVAMAMAGSVEGVKADGQAEATKRALGILEKIDGESIMQERGKFNDERDSE